MYIAGLFRNLTQILSILKKIFVYKLFKLNQKIHTLLVYST